MANASPQVLRQVGDGTLTLRSSRSSRRTHLRRMTGLVASSVAISVVFRLAPQPPRFEHVNSPPAPRQPKMQKSRPTFLVRYFKFGPGVESKRREYLANRSGSMRKGSLMSGRCSEDKGNKTQFVTGPVSGPQLLNLFGTLTWHATWQTGALSAMPHHLSLVLNPRTWSHLQGAGDFLS